MKKINGKFRDFPENNKVWITFNPYENVGLDEANPIIPNELVLDEVLEDTNGVQVKVSSFGAFGKFGKGTYSWMWIEFEKLNNI